MAERRDPNIPNGGRDGSPGQKKPSRGFDLHFVRGQIKEYMAVLVLGVLLGTLL